MIHDFITANFPDSNLDPIESFISHENHLRFELGDGFENGTITRVEHCVEKAVKIFESLFSNNDEVYMLIKFFEYDGGKEFYEATSVFLESQFLQFEEIIKSEKTVSISETDEFYDIEKDVSEIATVTTHHIQKIFKVDLSSVNYVNIFTGIANLEMGLSPAIAGNIFFINTSKKVAFNMYDDRGCIVFSKNKESIRFLYNELYDWLVEYHIKTFDNLFNRV